VPGAAVIVIVLLAFPIVVGLSGVVVAAALGWLLQRDGHVRYEGSELLETNV